MANRTESEHRIGERLFGREQELEALLGLFAPDGVELVTLTGVPGVGRSSLLHHFARAASQTGRRAFVLDCRTVEPSQRGFEIALASARGELPAGEPSVLCLDHYDHFLLLDAWLRAWFLRERGKGQRLVLAARRLPGLGWSTSGARTLEIQLKSLDEASTIELLRHAGVAAPNARLIWRLTRGHPLALRLALVAGHACAPSEFDALALPEVVRRLTGYFLEDVQDPQLREALEAASTVRRVTRPILDEMLDCTTGTTLYEALSALPLVEIRSDGLSLHPTVHAAVSRWLRSADPGRFTAYRRRAWRALERDRGNVATSDLWRHTADVIYLIDDPIVREAFFPSNSSDFAVEPARADDHEAILELVQSHDGAGQRELMARWLSVIPTAFHVVRDARGEVQGFYCLFDAAALTPQDLAADPVAAAWRSSLPDYLRDQPRRVLCLRRWLSREHGDRPSAVQAACWLDVKRAYLENRPQLQRVYLAVSDLAPYASAAAKLGFAPVCADLRGSFSSAMLDFGPGSVDAWLARLLRAELGMAEFASVDLEHHALRLGAKVVRLTPRELLVARILLDAAGAVVGREELLELAWAGGRNVGSNVIDVLVRGLRKKLMQHAEAIETVRGVGYRWRF